MTTDAEKSTFYKESLFSEFSVLGKSLITNGKGQMFSNLVHASSDNLVSSLSLTIHVFDNSADILGKFKDTFPLSKSLKDTDILLMASHMGLLYNNAQFFKFLATFTNIKGSTEKSIKKLCNKCCIDIFGDTVLSELMGPIQQEKDADSLRFEELTGGGNADFVFSIIFLLVGAYSLFRSYNQLNLTVHRFKESFVVKSLMEGSTPEFVEFAKANCDYKYSMEDKAFESFLHSYGILSYYVSIKELSVCLTQPSVVGNYIGEKSLIMLHKKKPELMCKLNPDMCKEWNTDTDFEDTESAEEMGNQMILQKHSFISGNPGVLMHAIEKDIKKRMGEKEIDGRDIVVYLKKLEADPASIFGGQNVDKKSTVDVYTPPTNFEIAMSIAKQFTTKSMYDFALGNTVDPVKEGMYDLKDLIREMQREIEKSMIDVRIDTNILLEECVKVMGYVYDYTTILWIAYSFSVACWGAAFMYYKKGMTTQNRTALEDGSLEDDSLEDDSFERGSKEMIRNGSHSSSPSSSPSYEKSPMKIEDTPSFVRLNSKMKLLGPKIVSSPKSRKSKKK